MASKFNEKCLIISYHTPFQLYILPIAKKEMEVFKMSKKKILEAILVAITVLLAPKSKDKD